MINQVYTQANTICKNSASWVAERLPSANGLVGRSVTWIKTQWPHVRTAGGAMLTQLQNIGAIAMRHLGSSLKTGTVLMREYKVWLILGGAVGMSLIFLYQQWKRRQAAKLTGVNVDLRSTLNVANISLKALKMEKDPLRVMLTFCIDASGSMDTADQGGLSRQAAVAKAVCSVLKKASQLIQFPQKAEFKIAIISFNSQPVKIQEATSLTQENVEFIKTQVKKISSDGSTNIIAGLESAIEEIGKNADGGYSHTLILPTDGESTLDGLDLIHEKLSSLKVKVFGLGIGHDHSKRKLKEIVNPENKKFEGRYIDMTASNDSIVEVIDEIYQEVVTTLKLKLSTTQLEPGTWSLDNRFSVPGTDGHSVCELPALSEGEELVRQIQIHPQKLNANAVVDLPTLRFTLSNNSGQHLTLPWKPTTSIDPNVWNKRA